jgi:hypothetical protein
MKLSFDYIVFNKGIETIDCIWDVRFYRNDIKTPWHNMLALRSEEATDLKVIAFKNYTTAQLEDFKKQTIMYARAEQRAKDNAAALPVVNLPMFANEEAMAKYLHQLFSNGSPEKIKAVFLQVMHPGFFENGSKVQLQDVQEQNLNNALSVAFAYKATYKQMYCLNAPIRVDNFADGRTAFYFSGAVKNCNSMFIIGPANMGYKEGVAQIETKLFEYSISVRQDDDAINYIKSFSSRKALCKND